MTSNISSLNDDIAPSSASHDETVPSYVASALHKNASVDDVLSSSYIVSSASVSWPYYDPMIVDSKVKYASYSTDVLKSNQSSRASVGIFIIALPFRILKLLMEFWRPTFLLMTLLQMSLFGYDFQL